MPAPAKAEVEAAHTIFKPWIWHKTACRVASIAEHDHKLCTCGLADLLASIHQPDPRAAGDRE